MSTDIQTRVAPPADKRIAYGKDPRSAYCRGDDEADAWKRTVDMLRRYRPLR